jgi:hypothetical protein
MRATITIDDEILEELRNRSAREGIAASRLEEWLRLVAHEAIRDLTSRAAEEGTSVGLLIEEFLRKAGQQVGGEAIPPFQLVTFGKGGRFTTFDVDRGSAFMEEEDLARYGRRE